MVAGEGAAGGRVDAVRAVVGDGEEGRRADEGRQVQRRLLLPVGRRRRGRGTGDAVVLLFGLPDYGGITQGRIDEDVVSLGLL